MATYRAKGWLQGAWAVGWQPTELKTGFNGFGAVGWQPTGLKTGFNGLGAVGWQPTGLRTGFKGGDGATGRELGAVGCGSLQG